MTNKEFYTLRDYINKHYGLKIPDFKKYLLESRLLSRMRKLDIPTYKEYIDYVFDPKNYEEIYNMIDVVTTHKTDFFRENDHFEYLTNFVLPNVKKTDTLKIWSSAVSTGEEAYSLVISIEEFKRLHNSNLKYKIYASDVSKGSLEYALRGIYKENRIDGIPINLRDRYFQKHKDPTQKLVKVKNNIIDKVDFFYLNLNDKKYSLGLDFDIIFCRNVLIYFDKYKQVEILKKIVNYLVPDGLLFIGHSESLISMDLPLKLFKTSIYQKKI